MVKRNEHIAKRRTLLLIVACFLPFVSQACQCVNFTVEQQMNDKYTEMIFQGKLIRAPSAHAYAMGKDEEVLFDISALYKGDSSHDQVTVNLDYACTGGLPTVGGEYLVFVHSSPGNYRITSDCNLFSLHPEDYNYEKGIQKLTDLQKHYPAIKPASSSMGLVFGLVFIVVATLFGCIFRYLPERIIKVD